MLGIIFVILLCVAIFVIALSVLAVYIFKFLLNRRRLLPREYQNLLSSYRRIYVFNLKFSILRSCDYVDSNYIDETNINLLKFMINEYASLIDKFFIINHDLEQKIKSFDYPINGSVVLEQMSLFIHEFGAILAKRNDIRVGDLYSLHKRTLNICSLLENQFTANDFH